jgi:serine/threonine-protein kinase
MNRPETELAEREEQLGELFSDWLERVERGEAPNRREWLARHPELAAELEECLAEEERMHALAAPLREVARAATVAALPAPPGPAAGDRADLPGPFGDCELLEEIGRGGMAVVYRARQKGLGRLVALKLFRADLPNREGDLQRFRHEAEVVAQLDHPRIVPVYEVGEQRGHLFFTMKLLEGGGLDDHLADFAEAPREAARLVAAVARAVHHAHQRGILHRDLKPSNILLGAGPPCEPHVSDFGLAKRVGIDLGLTHSGAVLGTPSYMAPEQALGQQVTTATDVYGLGAVLYALLTGRAPFQAGSVLQTLERVKERAPEPPRRHNPKVARDLETICLKCLRKEPHRRYASAAALADDLEHFLDGRAIQARPVGPIERATRWAGRQPVVAGLVLALACALTTGLGLVLYQWQRAQSAYAAAADQRDEAQASRELAEGRRLTAEASAKDAFERKADADHSLRLAHEVVKDFTTRLSEGGELEAHGLEPLRLELLRKAQRYFGQFIERRGTDPAFRHELLEASAGLANILRLTGSAEEALVAYGRALALAEALARDEPGNAALRLAQAQVHNHIGACHGSLGRRDEALASLRRAQAVLAEGLRAHPKHAGLRDELASTLHNRAMSRQAANDLGGALALYEEALAIYKQLLREQSANTDCVARLANGLNNLGLLRDQQGRKALALEALREALALREGLARRFPANLAHQRALGESLCNVAEVLCKGGRPKDALMPLRRASALLEALTRTSPHVHPYRLQWGLSLGALGRAHLMSGDARGSVAPLERAREVFQHLVADHPGVVDYLRRLETVGMELGEAHTHLRQRKQAQLAYELARDAHLRLPRTGPVQAKEATRLAVTLYNIGLAQAIQGNLKEARSSLLAAGEQQRRALELAPGTLLYRQRLSGGYALLAQIQRDLGRPDEALDTVKKRFALWSDDANELTGVMRDFALTASACKGDRAMREHCVDLALEALRRAVRAGFRDAERARSDPVLAVVRERAEFEQALAGLPGVRPAPP